jgi:hypothetical protein
LRVSALDIPHHLLLCRIGLFDGDERGSTVWVAVLAQGQHPPTEEVGGAFRGIVHVDGPQIQTT